MISVSFIDFLDGPYPEPKEDMDEFCSRVPQDIQAKIGVVVGNHEESGILAMDNRFFTTDAIHLRFQKYE